MALPTNNFEYYMQAVQLATGQAVTPFPTGTPTADQKKTMNAINQTLRYLNNKYWLAFNRVEFVMNPIPFQFTDPSGIPQYDLSLPPYNQLFWHITRMDEHAVIRIQDGIPVPRADNEDIDNLRPQFAASAYPRVWSAYGQYLRLFPKPSHNLTLKIRYFPKTGAQTNAGVLQAKLINEDDRPILGDDYEDVITYLAAKRFLLHEKSSPRTVEVTKEADEQEAIIAERHKPGKNAVSRVNIEVEDSMSYLMRKSWPFGSGSYTQ